MSKQKKMLMWLVILTGMFQMPSIAISAAVHTMSEVIFHVDLVKVQSSLSVTGIVSPIVSFISAFLIRKDIATKRGVVIFGLGALGVTGIISAFMFQHTFFWSIAALSVAIGIATGCYVSTAISLVIDGFSVDERRKINGLHSVFVGIGGILISTVGGLLVNYVWYAGYLILMIGIPMCIFSVIAIPKTEKKKTNENGEAKVKSKLDPDVFFYIAIIFVFMFLYNSGSSNMSTHLENSGIENYAMIAGFVTAAQMGGTMVMSMFFNKLSQKLGDMLLVLAFAAIFVGFTIVNVFHSSVVMIFIGIFLMGTSMPCLGPQCLLSISKRVDDSTSALASSMANGVAPGLGSFLSPIIITNFTVWIAGNNTNFRYQFVAFLALGCAIILFALNKVREKKLAGKYN
ncbi:MAG: MFS transporter [Oscillospiraceae bacterium]|nr:MFS transporter [Oscillospiraceae bacterium]